MQDAFRCIRREITDKFRTLQMQQMQGLYEVLSAPDPDRVVHNPNQQDHPFLLGIYSILAIEFAQPFSTVQSVLFPVVFGIRKAQYHSESLLDYCRSSLVARGWIRKIVTDAQNETAATE